MVNLVYPRATDKTVCALNGFMLGPFGTDMDSQYETYNYQSLEDKLDEFGVSLYHENSVAHIHHEGDLLYDPLYGKISPRPTSVYLDQIRLSYSAGLTLDFTMGRASGDLSSRNIYGTSNGINQMLFRVNSTQWKMYDLNFLRPSHRVYTFTWSTWTMSSITATKVNFTYKKEYYDIMGTPMVGNYNWELPQDQLAFEAVQAYVTAHKFAALRSSTGTWSVNRYDVLTEIDFTDPQVIFLQADAKIRSLVQEPDFELPDEKPYGDLAMEAVENLDAINVNMIAFLRDLRNPLQLIPKLKNLGSLKGAAKNFLAVDYGILPTVSDLKRIVAAFKRVKPHLDKSGFQTCGAGQTVVAVNEISTITVVRRIKLGLAKEDDAFEALEQGLDSIGMLPTLENLWDLIPYSFVLDWFVDVGGFLERADALAKLSRLNIRYVTMSRKVTVDSTVTQTQVPRTSGSIHRVEYHRWVNDRTPLPPLSLQLVSRTFNHWLEAGALILQRTH